MNWTLHWKVITLLGYIALVTLLLICGEEALPRAVTLRLASPL